MRRSSQAANAKVPTATSSADANFHPRKGGVRRPLPQDAIASESESAPEPATHAGAGGSPPCDEEDEAIMRTRLMIDGDGDDRRLNVLLKNILAFCKTTEEDPGKLEGMHTMLVAQVDRAQYDFNRSQLAQARSRYETSSYLAMCVKIEQDIVKAGEDIRRCKVELNSLKSARSVKAFKKKLADQQVIMGRLKEIEKTLDMKLAGYKLILTKMSHSLRALSGADDEDEKKEKGKEKEKEKKQKEEKEKQDAASCVVTTNAKVERNVERKEENPAKLTRRSKTERRRSKTERRNRRSKTERSFDDDCSDAESSFETKERIAKESFKDGKSKSSEVKKVLAETNFEAKKNLAEKSFEAKKNLAEKSFEAEKSKKMVEAEKSKKRVETEKNKSIEAEKSDKRFDVEKYFAETSFEGDTVQDDVDTLSPAQTEGAKEGISGDNSFDAGVGPYVVGWSEERKEWIELPLSSSDAKKNLADEVAPAAAAGGKKVAGNAKLVEEAPSSDESAGDRM